jgi:hypothetical protein
MRNLVVLLVLLVATQVSAADYYFLSTSSCEGYDSQSKCISNRSECSWCTSAAVGDSCMSTKDASVLPAAIFSCNQVASSGVSSPTLDESKDDALVGEWQMQTAYQDSIIELFGTDVLLVITKDSESYHFQQKYGKGASAVWNNYTAPITTNSCIHNQPVGTHVFAQNALEGLRYLPDATLSACNVGAIAKGAMQVKLSGFVHGSTGKVMMHRALTFAPMAGKLVVQEQRSSREGVQAWAYARANASVDKAATAHAEESEAAVDVKPKAVSWKQESKQYSMTFDDDWDLTSTAPEKIMLISLQAAANKNEPRLYFDYGPNWDFTYCAAIKSYYEDSRGMDLTELASTADALAALATSDVVSSYVVYDDDVRESILVAMTVAGILNALVVSQELISMLPEAMTMAYDLRGKFTGFTPAQTYSWAWKEFKDQTSRETVIWLGGECGTTMKPGVADYGIRANAFFTDLNTRPLDDPLCTPEEYTLADEIMGSQKKYSMVQGWHAYCKDMERTFVSLSSSHSLRVEGLHTIPNLSFNTQVPISEGFQFKNNHNVEPGNYPAPEDKVYITAVQTDALGLGAWIEPGRGAIPYAWECTLNFLWLQPAVLEYYFSTATPNDYFIGALSGPGYMYPKAIPKEDLPGMIAIANTLIEQLALRVFETMDYSQGSTVVGNTDLTREVVDTYYKEMPNIMGFVNGYSPSFTFDNRDGRPFVSFDYYLAPPPDAKTGGGTTDEAIADLMELAALNKKEGEPYFLLMHVREWSNVTRVQEILERVPSIFETVPMDTFVALAGQAPTFENNFCPPEAMV